MDFWKVYRLVFNKRWLIVSIMLLAAAVIYVGATLQGQKKSYQAEAYLQLLERSLSALPTGTTVGPDPRQTREGNVSAVIMELRRSNDVMFRAANLLRLPEQERAAQVESILEANGTFGQLEGGLATQVDQQVRSGQLSAADRDALLRQQVAMGRSSLVNSIALARDDEGAFAPAGMTQSIPAIVDRIRGNTTYEALSGPLASEAIATLFPWYRCARPARGRPRPA
jgi:hypothetical protein